MHPRTARPHARSLAAVAATVAALALAGPAAAATTPTTATSGTRPTAAPTVASVTVVDPTAGDPAGTAGTGDAPTRDEVIRQHAEAARLEAEASARAEQRQAAQARLSELSVAAGAALEQYVAARDEAWLARTQEQAERRRLAHASAVLETERRDLGRYAAAAYRTGGSLGELAVAAELLGTEHLGDFGRNAAILQYAGNRKSTVVDRVEDAALLQRQATAAAEEHKRTAEAAERRAAAAKKRSDDLVAQQQTVVAQLEAVEVQAKGAARDAGRRADQLQRRLDQVIEERRLAAEAARADAQARGEVVLMSIDFPTDGCAGEDIGSYPNGQIPRDALCPLWGATWHILRADAAAAFNAMSKEYAKTFGKPICVTDSYRSYEMQVDVHRRKPNMTAIPGTSNHGWARAVDLCDGINSFGTATHSWMRDNAPRFGWYHPTWAQQGGSRPEPWHWEYGG